MADTDTTLTYKKLFCINNYESLFTTSTTCKSANDSVYNTTSSTFIRHSSSNNLSNYTTGKLKNSTNAEDSIILTPLPCAYQESQKELKKISVLNYHLQMQISRINTYLKKDVCQTLSSKNLISQKVVYHKHINLEGRRKIDFMYYLAKRHNFFPVTEKIFSFLHGKDIVTMSMVSKIWRNVVKHSSLAKRKKGSYLKYMESVKENIGYCKIKHSSHSSKRILADVTNIMQFQLKTNR